MKYIIQPYHFWQGHFAPYFENLLNKEKSYKFVYCGEKKILGNNIVKIKPYIDKCEVSFCAKIKCRIINNFKVIKYLNSQLKDGDVVHFIEFEPITYLYFYLFNKKKQVKIIQTVHSINRIKYDNKIKDIISIIQRKIFNIALVKAEKLGTTFVVHYASHKKQLSQIINKNSIELIHYPCPFPKVNKIKNLTQKKLLLFGIVREDKGIYEFLKCIKEQNDLFITVAGKIIDKRVLKFKKLKQFHFIDKYLDDKEIFNLFKTHDFLVLPYSNKYTGGAGPLKDSFAYATPVICSGIEIFKDIVKNHNTGIIANNFEKLNMLVRNIDQSVYQLMSKQCLCFAQKYNWIYMKKKYYNLYERI